MTNLTEQWKKDELLDGHYYVEDTGENMIAEYVDGYFYNNGEPMTSFSGGVNSVLAPVPSYEEWKASYNCMLENEVLRLKNAQLKELLKECELWFTGIIGNINDKNVGEHNRNIPIGNFEHAFRVFSQKISQVLGEE